jgi:glutamate synthase domain-containing protein 3
MTDKIVGFLHNLSPLKHSDKTKYFDVQVQTKNGIVRGICFALQTCGKFETSNRKPPVKMKNVLQKDEGHLRTILTNFCTQLEETNVDFDLVAINKNQLVTLKAKVVQISGEKIATTRSAQSRREKDSFSTHSDPYEL